MNKPTTYDPKLETPADAKKKIRAMFAEMGRMDERIAKDQETIVRLSIQTAVNLSEVKISLERLQAGYKKPESDRDALLRQIEELKRELAESRRQNETKKIE